MEVEIGKYYKHYKNGHLYQVVTIARHTETGEEMVVYQGQYDSEDLGPNPMFVRPKEMFEGQVEHNGIVQDRFTSVHEEDED